MDKDYLKYWRVIRYFIKSKYGLTQEDLDMLLFLKTEDYFDRDKFMEFDELMSWNKNRFEQLRHDGWIEVFRKRLRDRKALYQPPPHHQTRCSQRMSSITIRSIGTLSKR
jgi:hypothetical protein